MRAIILNRYGNESVLQYVKSFPIPSFKEDEVLIEMKAASLNPIDWKIMKGQARLILPYRFPLILGNDGSGIILEVGKNCTRLKKGDEVFFRPSKNKIGTLAQFIAVNESEVSLKPRNLNFIESASLPLVGLTCFQSLFKIGKINSNSKVFINGGSGGVGTFAIQFAKAYGAYVSTTCSSKNSSLVRKLGVDQVIDYTKENFWTKLKNYDIAFDFVGGKSLDFCFPILKEKGKVISIATVPSRASLKNFNLSEAKLLLIDFLNLKYKRLSKKYNVEYHYHFMNSSGEQLQVIKNLVESGKIHPVIDKIYNLTETKSAFSYLQTGRARGKIIITI
jgi:alcohol dehydrogenase